MRSTGPMICTQPPFMPGLTRLNYVKESSPFSCTQRSPDFSTQADIQSPPWESLPILASMSTGLP